MFSATMHKYYIAWVDMMDLCYLMVSLAQLTLGGFSPLGLEQSGDLSESILPIYLSNPAKMMASSTSHLRSTREDVSKDVPVKIRGYIRFDDPTIASV